MAQTTFTVRMDADTKKAFSELCSNIGLTMSTAFSIYAKKAVAEQRIPFSLTANTDTVSAIKEVEKLKKDPNKKIYNSFSEVLEELETDE